MSWKCPESNLGLYTCNKRSIATWYWLLPYVTGLFSWHTRQGEDRDFRPYTPPSQIQPWHWYMVSQSSLNPARRSGVTVQPTQLPILDQHFHWCKGHGKHIWSAGNQTQTFTLIVNMKLIGFKWPCLIPWDALYKGLSTCRAFTPTVTVRVPSCMPVIKFYLFSKCA